MMRTHKEIFKITMSAIFLAIAFILPFLTGQIAEIGSQLCPMHLPVLLCGFICGWTYGLVVGLCAPLIRSQILSMPPLYLTALCMSFELATYGVVSALMYKILPNKKGFIYVALLIAMLAGRIVWGMSMFMCVGLNFQKFGLNAFISGALLNAIPGIILQIILVPILVIVYNKVFRKNNEVENGKKRK